MAENTSMGRAVCSVQRASSSFGGVIGFGADDKLPVSNAGNLLTGGKSADVLDGRGRKEQAKYSASDGGVTVTLDSAKRSGCGGDAEGDRLVNIERVHGSVQNIKLTAATATTASSAMPALAATSCRAAARACPTVVPATINRKVA